MQAPSTLLRGLDLIGPTPSVGDLMGLCEENYGALRRLAPALPGLSGRLVSGTSGQAMLMLEVLEQAPYTTTLRLTHLFDAPPDVGAPEPDALLRAYHDAGQAEVLDLRQTVLPLCRDYRSPALAAKWRVNLFLSKWLGYCVREGHRFPQATQRPAAATQRELLPIL